MSYCPTQLQRGYNRLWTVSVQSLHDEVAEEDEEENPKPNRQKADVLVESESPEVIKGCYIEESLE